MHVSNVRSSITKKYILGGFFFVNNKSIFIETDVNYLAQLSIFQQVTGYNHHKHVQVLQMMATSLCYPNTMHKIFHHSVYSDAIFIK